MANGMDPEKMEVHDEWCFGDDKDNFGSNRILKVVGGWIYWRTIYAISVNKNENRKPCGFAGVFVPEK